jgi:predicted nucleic acid-binding protein
MISYVDKGDFLIMGSNSTTVRASLSLVSQHQISWWDSLILEAALRANADVLVSEVGQHQRQFGKLRIENPFI